MCKRRPAFTLIEMVVYIGLFLMVGLLLAKIFTVSRRTQQTTASAYAVSGQVDTAMQWLRQDFQETALGTIRAYPAASGPVAPAASLISARGPESSGDSQGTMVVSEFGVPAWTKQVFYGLRRSGTSTTGDLIRWEVPLAANEQDRLPRVATMPTAFSQVAKPRVVLHNVVAPGQTINGLGGLSSGWSNPQWGGFRVEFVRRQGGEGGAESLSAVNPAQNLLTPGDNTRLVEIGLAISEPSMGPPNFYTTKFRVCPRY